jgi:hypothetical protein
MEISPAAVLILLEELNQTQQRYTDLLKQTTITYGMLTDTLRAVRWVLEQFIPVDDIPAWIEQGRVALLERTLEESGNGSTTP